MLGVSVLLGGALLLKDQATPLTIVATLRQRVRRDGGVLRGRAYYIDT